MRQALLVLFTIIATAVLTAGAALLALDPSRLPVTLSGFTARPPAAAQPARTSVPETPHVSAPAPASVPASVPVSVSVSAPASVPASVPVPVPASASATASPPPIDFVQLTSDLDDLSTKLESFNRKLLEVIAQAEAQEASKAEASPADPEPTEDEADS